MNSFSVSTVSFVCMCVFFFSVFLRCQWALQALACLHWLFVNKLNSIQVVLKLSWALAPFKRLSTLVASCSSIKIPSFGLCLYSWLPEKRSVASKRGRRAPLEKPWLRNKSCKRLGCRPKRSMQSLTMLYQVPQTRPTHLMKRRNVLD